MASNRLGSAKRLKAADELAAFIATGGDAKEFMQQFHPEDAVLINDMAFTELSGIYHVHQADIDCLPFLTLCSPEFVQARKEMGRHLLNIFS